jgi:hypothetical protein
VSWGAVVVESDFTVVESDFTPSWFSEVFLESQDATNNETTARSTIILFFIKRLRLKFAFIKKGAAGNPTEKYFYIGLL